MQHAEWIMYAVIRSGRLRFAINIYHNSEDVLRKNSTKGSLPRESYLLTYLLHGAESFLRS